MIHRYTPSTRKPTPWLRTLAALAVIAGATLLPARRAAALFGPIIFDPWAMGKHVQQVEELAEQVALAARQIANQIQELAHINPDIAPNDPATVAGLTEQLDASLYATPAPAGQLDERYPPDMSSATWNQYQADQAAWESDQRQSLVENRQLQNQVYQDMQGTREEVAQLVQASNSAPGETAVAQAHDDLLAVASGELAKLQALKAARSRLKTENQARQQSELSYAAAEQTRVRSGGDNPPPPSGAVVDPFAN